MKIHIAVDHDVPFHNDERRLLEATIERVSPSYEEWIVTGHRLNNGTPVYIAHALSNHWTGTGFSISAIAEKIGTRYPRVRSQPRH